MAPSSSSSSPHSSLLSPPFLLLPSFLISSLLLILFLLPFSSSFFPSPSPSPSPTPSTPIRALVIVDMQLCFSPTGPLPVPSYDSILPIINRLHVLPFFTHTVLTQDWHPQGHVSFHTSHPSAAAFSTVNLTYHPTTGHLCSPSHLPYSYPCPPPSSLSPSPSSPSPPSPSSSHLTVTQTLWPPHCIASTPDASLHPHLLTLPSDLVIYKGTQAHVDAYSPFHDVRGNGWGGGLEGVLRGWGVGEVWVVGVALDVCVKATVLDAVESGGGGGGWDVVVVRDATAGIGDGVKEVEEMKRVGVRFVDSEDVKGYSEQAEWVVSEE